MKRKLLQISVLIIIIFCFTMFQGGFVSWFILFSVSPFLLYALVVLLWRDRIVSVEREITPMQVTAGDDVDVYVYVRRKTFFPFAYMTLHEQMNNKNVGMYRENHSATVKIGGFSRNFMWHYTLKGLPRGEYRYMTTTLQGSDFLGFATNRFSSNQTETILVYPKMEAIIFQPIQATYESGIANTPRSAVKDATMAVGVRDYEQGDRLSWIHWKSFAKSQELRTKEFEERQSEAVSIVLDTRYSIGFEQTVSLAASLAKTFFEAQGELAFSTVSNPSELIRVHYQQHFDHVMRQLAIVQPADYGDVRASNAKGFATTIFITPHLTKEDLQAFSRFHSQVICLVIGEPGKAMHMANVKVHYVTGSFNQVLREVSRQ